ncbi:hypothetical protein N7537_001345, partial [Penicillium hordei]
RGVLALLENIQASERTSELLNKVGRQLLSVKKRLEYYIRGRGYIFLRYQTQLQSPHLSSGDYSPSLYLYESDSSSFDIFEEIELRLFSESL